MLHKAKLAYSTRNQSKCIWSGKIFSRCFLKRGLFKNPRNSFNFKNLSILTPLLRNVAQSKTAQFHFGQEQTCLIMKIFFRMFSELEIAQGSQKYFCFPNLSMLKPLLCIVAQSKTSLFHYKPMKMHMRWKTFSGCFLRRVMFKDLKNSFGFEIS